MNLPVENRLIKIDSCLKNVSIMNKVNRIIFVFFNFYYYFISRKITRIIYALGLKHTLTQTNRFCFL